MQLIVKNYFVLFFCLHFPLFHAPWLFLFFFHWVYLIFSIFLDLNLSSYSDYSHVCSFIKLISVITKKTNEMINWIKPLTQKQTNALLKPTFANKMRRWDCPTAATVDISDDTVELALVRQTWLLKEANRVVRALAFRVEKVLVSRKKRSSLCKLCWWLTASTGGFSRWPKTSRG